MDAESGLVVRFADVESVVGPLRSALDPATPSGMPAHVTVLYPFVPPAELFSAVLAQVAAVASQTQTFRVQFEKVGWFSDQVLWLAPEPDSPFRDLTSRFRTLFPQCLPYGGAFDDLIPHLTIEAGVPIIDLQEAERALTGRLPIRTTATHLSVLTGSVTEGRWTVRGEFAFASG